MASNECVSVDSGRISWTPWSQSVEVPAGPVTIDGTVSDSYDGRTKTGDQWEAFDLAGRVTDDVPDGVDAASVPVSLAFDWSGGALPLSWVSGSARLEVQVCWPVAEAPPTTLAPVVPLPELVPAPSVPEVTVPPVLSVTVPLPDGVAEVTVPPVVSEPVASLPLLPIGVEVVGVPAQVETVATVAPVVETVAVVAAQPRLPETGTEYVVPLGFTAFVLVALGWWCVRRPAHRAVA